MWNHVASSCTTTLVKTWKDSPYWLRGREEGGSCRVQTCLARPRSLAARGSLRRLTGEPPSSPYTRARHRCLRRPCCTATSCLCDSAPLLPLTLAFPPWGRAGEVPCLPTPAAAVVWEDKTSASGMTIIVRRLTMACIRRASARSSANRRRCIGVTPPKRCIGSYR